MRAALHMDPVPLLISLVCTMSGCGLNANDESAQDSDVRISATTTDEVIPAYGLNFSRFPRAGTHLGLLPECSFDPADTFNEYATLRDNHVPYARVDFLLNLDEKFDPVNPDRLFKCIDMHMTEAAANGVYILPIVRVAIEGHDALFLPTGPGEPQHFLANLTAFAERLAMTYGPCGSFWAGQPSALAIRAWEVLNEPNYQQFFVGSATAYRTILTAVREGLRKGDPRARIVFGGLSSITNLDVLNNEATKFLSNFFDKPKDRCLVDAVAYHPYAHTADLMEQRATAIVNIMRSNKLRLIDGPSSNDDAQLWITELGWGIARSLPVHPDKLEGPLVEDEDNQRDAIRRSAFLGNQDRGQWRLGPTIWYLYTDEIASGLTGWASVAGVYKSDAKNVQEPAHPAWETIGNFAKERTWEHLPSVHSCGVKEANAAEKRLLACPR